VINDHIFAFLGGEFISRVNNNMALISYPFTPHDFFLSPELLKIKTLPSNVHYKTAFFSLGCLALHLLLPDNEFYLKQEQIDLEKLLNSSPIKHTKLYWLLSRCLVLDPENRSILFI
jgi:serine/threonine protein kinase